MYIQKYFVHIFNKTIHIHICIIIRNIDGYIRILKIQIIGIYEILIFDIRITRISDSIFPFDEYLIINSLFSIFFAIIKK